MKRPLKKWYVYILECSDGSFYTGSTTDVERRLREHLGDGGAKYTRGRRPLKLVLIEQHMSRSGAQRREAEIKKLSRMGKETLVAKGKRRGKKGAVAPLPAAP
jgi:putative endonuclease